MYDTKLEIQVSIDNKKFWAANERSSSPTCSGIQDPLELLLLAEDEDFDI